jgi:pimeloyl-ACP methyl ester carboxylesterase
MLGLVISAVFLTACATRPMQDETPLIVFVHGNGDTAALWQTTQWRFESNGWPRERLHAIEMPYPLARDEDSKAQLGRASNSEHMGFLKNDVDKVLKSTGASKVVLFGNSRGGYVIRNYIQNGGGAATVSHAILGGTPNHGIWSIKGFREDSEMAGTGSFLTALNAPKNANGDEVVGPIKWLTIRSDSNDKYAQPDGLWIGVKGMATNVTAAGPELKGATNVVIPGIDHRETAYSPAAFDAAYRFITGKAPKFVDIQSEPTIVLNGTITGKGVKSDDPRSGDDANNLPIPGAKLEIFATDATTGARLGNAVHIKTVGPDGLWGPFPAQGSVQYEFVITAPGYATTHIYRSPFPRSSTIVNLRPERIINVDKNAQSLIIFSRPRGYFDAQRDKMSFDGQWALPGVPPTGAGVDISTMILTEPGIRSVSAEFNGERLTGRTWKSSEGDVVMLELTQ